MNKGSMERIRLIYGLPARRGGKVRLKDGQVGRITRTVTRQEVKHALYPVKHLLRIRLDEGNAVDIDPRELEYL